MNIIHHIFRISFFMCLGMAFVHPNWMRLRAMKCLPTQRQYERSPAASCHRPDDSDSLRLPSITVSVSFYLSTVLPFSTVLSLFLPGWDGCRVWKMNADRNCARPSARPGTPPFPTVSIPDLGKRKLRLLNKMLKNNDNYSKKEEKHLSI